jgi:4-hydroxy-tetrahydrodipicolinate synthase
MFIETNPISVKTAMKLLGRVNGALRLPMSPMAESNVAKLKAALEAYGVT